MVRRYLSVFKNHVIVIALIAALIIAGAVTEGRMSEVTTTASGILMIYAAIVLAIWIIKMPARRSKNESI